MLKVKLTILSWRWQRVNQRCYIVRLDENHLQTCHNLKQQQQQLNYIKSERTQVLQVLIYAVEIRVCRLFKQLLLTCECERGRVYRRTSGSSLLISIIIRHAHAKYKFLEWSWTWVSHKLTSRRYVGFGNEQATNFK